MAKTHFLFSFAILATLALPSAGHASELFGGVYRHAVDTPLSFDSRLESGYDLQLGLRGGPIIGPLEPYLLAALNSTGDTSYAAAGLSWKIGDRVFVRPGLGIALHNGSAANFQRTDKIAFGSRVLFAPEFAIGARFTPRMTVEASWIHLSHAQLFGRQNPGIDNIGARLSFAL